MANPRQSGLRLVKPKAKVQRLSTLRLGEHVCEVPKCFEQWRTTTYTKTGNRKWKLATVTCLMNRHVQKTRRGKQFANPELTREQLKALNAKKVVPIA